MFLSYCVRHTQCVYHSLLEYTLGGEEDEHVGHNSIVIYSQVGGNEGRPPCKEVEEEPMKEGEEEQKVLRISHNLFNTTLRPLVSGLEYQGAVKTLRKLLWQLTWIYTPLYCDVGLAHLVNAGYAKLSTTKLISSPHPPISLLSSSAISPSPISPFAGPLFICFPSFSQCCYKLPLSIHNSLNSLTSLSSVWLTNATAPASFELTSTSSMASFTKLSPSAQFCHHGGGAGIQGRVGKVNLCHLLSPL